MFDSMIADLTLEDRPRERMHRHGPRTMSDAELLAIYAAAARDGDGAAIETVRSDVERMRAELRGRVGKNGHTRAGEAHELYRRRELAETPRYAGVG